MIFRKLHMGFTVAMAIFVVSGCGSTKLLDIEKTSKTLQFSAEQREVARTKIQQIEKIVEDYELEKKTLESELTEIRNQMRGGGTRFGGRGRFGGNQGTGMGGGLQAKMQSFYQQRTEYQNQIDVLIAEMQVILNEEQREKFAEIKLPELELPEVGRGRNLGGSRRRGGGGKIGGFGG